MAGISKAEYLKRYMSGTDKDEKKKKKKKIGKTVSKHARSKIIDDDIDVKSLLPSNMETTIEEELGEDDPTIVAIIDERPDNIRQLESYRHSDGRWKTLANDDKFDTSILKSLTEEEIIKNKKSLFKGELKPNLKPQENSLKQRTKGENLSSRQRRHDSDSNSPSPPKRRVRHDSSSDTSPPRKMRHDSDSDAAPQRGGRHDSDSDTSLPRRNIQNSESDKSPRRTRHDSESDESPPRRKRQDSDSDKSPPRRKRRNSDSDESPPRRKRHSSDSDESPPRRKRHSSDSDESPPRRKRHDSIPDQSPSNKKDKMTKTLSGKKAGLSSAKDMKVEAEKIKRKEDEAFKNIGDEALGRNATTVFRDRKTGKKRNLDMEAEEDRAKFEKQRKMAEKYEQWGKGLKQQEQQQKNVEDHLYEMSKPLARSKDDEDLDKQLKEMERADDPMLKFIKKKKPKEKSKTKELPKYKGPPPPPNRFNLMPGYRWDGVDRSNGFESKYFSSISNKKAVSADAYKWSVEDM